MKKIIILVLSTVFQLFATVNAQQKSAGFLLQEGKDTISIERFARTADSLRGRLLGRDQVAVLFEAALAADQTIKELAVEVPQPGVPEGGAPLQKGLLRFRESELITVSEENGEQTFDTISTKKNALAYHPDVPMISLLEQIVLRAQEIKGDKVEVPVFLMNSNGKTEMATVQFHRKDSAEVALPKINIQLSLTPDGGISSGKTSDGKTISRLEVVPDKLLTTTAPDYSAPPDAPYSAEEVKVTTAGGITLVGTLTLPKNVEGQVPVVVTISGSSKHNRDHGTPFGGRYKFFRNLADTLGRQGIAVLRMDDRGVGGSEGNLEKATTAERADDNRAAIAFARKHSKISNVFLLGMSEGGLIAPMIAATDPELQGIVLMAGPGSTGEEVMRYQVKMGAKRIDSLTSAERTGFVQEELKEIREKAKNDPWLNFFLDYNPLKTAREVSEVPVLILQGTTDKNVPPEDAKKLKTAFEQAGNSDVTLQMFENINHIFVKDKNGYPQNYHNLESFQVAPEVMQAIVAWFVDHTDQ